MTTNHGFPSEIVHSLLKVATGADLVVKARAAGLALDDVVLDELESLAGELVMATRMHPEDALAEQSAKAEKINQQGLEAQINCLLALRGRPWLEQVLRRLSAGDGFGPATA